MKYSPLVAFFLFFIAFFNQAVENCENIAPENIIRVGSGNVLAPFHYFKGGKVTGLDIEIVQLVLTKADFCFQYVKTPSSARSMLELQQGRIDMLFSASYTEQRAKFSYFSIPYRNETIAIFWQPKQGQNSQNIVDLKAMLTKNLRGVINLGGYYGKEVKQLLTKKGIKIHRVNSIARRMKMLLAHRVDFVIEDELSGRYYLKKHNIDVVSIHPYIVHQDTVAFMFSKKSFNFKQLTRINHAIAACKEQIQQIVERYKR